MSPTKPNTPNTLAQEDRAQILATIRKLVPERHINVSNPNQDYGPWLELVDKAFPSLIETDDPEKFAIGVNALLSALGGSHTAFFHDSHQGVPSHYSINASLREVDTRDGKRWMFEDVIEDGIAFRAGIRAGELLLSVDSQPIAPPDRAAFHIGAHHQLEVGNFNGDRRPIVIEVPNKAAKDRPPLVEPPSILHRMLATGVGLIKVATFPDIVGVGFAKTLDNAIRDLKAQGLERLVVDLRGNFGGALGSLRLMSYLCPSKVEIGYSVTRNRFRKGYRKEKLPRIDRIPSTKAGLLFMFVRFKYIQKDRSLVLATEGLGPQPFHGRTVILINEHSHSAAEMVAGFAKDRKLATLVGTRTAGEVQGGANFKLSGDYTLRIPVAGWYTWQGECIEGKGVEPDVAIENTPQSLANGVDEQLQEASKVVSKL